MEQEHKDRDKDEKKHKEGGKDNRKVSHARWIKVRSVGTESYTRGAREV